MGVDSRHGKGMIELKARIRHLYANGFTAEGFISQFASMQRNLDYVFIFKGAPGTGKTLLIKEIVEALTSQGIDLELIHSPRGQNDLDGLLIPKVKIGLFISSPPFTFDSNQLEVRGEVLNLDVCLNKDQLAQKKDEIRMLSKQVQEKYSQAVAHLAAAKRIHLEKEEIYVRHMNFEKANQLTDRLITDIFANQVSKQSSRNVRYLFLGAATPEGVVNYIDNLTELMEKRVIIKGRAGSGKSTILTKIVKEAQGKGYDLEIYQCGFDPKSLDMVLIPELKVAILDGTPPHPIEASRPGDLIVDMYELCFTKDVDQDCQAELQEVTDRYKELTEAAIVKLQEAESLQQRLKKLYARALNSKKLELVRQEVLTKVLTRCST